MILALIAITCSPVFTADSVTICDSAAIGREVMAIPGSKWLVSFEDLIGLGDHDFNDAAATVWFDSSLAHVEWYAGLSVLDNRIGFGNGWPVNVNSGSKHAAYIPGSPFVLELRTSERNVLYSGAGSRNPDGQRHAWVTRAQETPEPAALILAAIGLAVFAVRRSGLA